MGIHTCPRCGRLFPNGTSHVCVGGHPNTLSTHQLSIYSHGNSQWPTATDRIAMRLRLPSGELLPFDFMAAHEAPDMGRVYVFIVNQGKPITFDDDYYLFPSDTLITQLRLLMESKS